MGAFNPHVVTEKGRNLIAKSLMGETKLVFTKIAVSEERLTGDLSTLTSIGTLKQSKIVPNVEVLEGNKVRVSATFTNDTLVQGYYVRNIGLYALDPDEDEILYSVATADETVARPDWMPPVAENGVTSVTVNVITLISNTQDVVLEVDPASAVTVQQFNEHVERFNNYAQALDKHTVNRQNPHGVTLEQVGITFGTEDLVAGTSELATGHIHFVYE